jgi:hypothetical protein
MAIIDVNQDILTGIDKEQQRTFYDTITITSGSNTISAGTQSDIWTATASKTLRNSNLSTNGMLPIQFSAVIYRFRIASPGNLIPADLQAISENATFQMYRNQNELVYEDILSSLGNIGGVAGVSEDALTGTSHAFNFGPGNSDQVKGLMPFGQIGIAAGMSFRGSVTWSDAVTLASGTNSFELRFFFDCKLLKPVS